LNNFLYFRNFKHSPLISFNKNLIIGQQSQQLAILIPQSCLPSTRHDFAVPFKTSGVIIFSRVERTFKIGQSWLVEQQTHDPKFEGGGGGGGQQSLALDETIRIQSRKEKVTKRLAKVLPIKLADLVSRF
jgi:hypothetical protein